MSNRSNLDEAKQLYSEDRYAEFIFQILHQTFCVSHALESSNHNHSFSHRKEKIQAKKLKQFSILPPTVWHLSFPWSSSLANFLESPATQSLEFLPVCMKVKTLVSLVSHLMEFHFNLWQEKVSPLPIRERRVSGLCSSLLLFWDSLLL